MSGVIKTDLVYPAFQAPAPRVSAPYTGVLPRVLDYHVIVRPKPPLTHIGLLALADRTKRANLATETVGQVLAVGANAFSGKVGDRDMAAETNWPKVGGWCIYKRQAGQPIRSTREMERVKAAGGSSADEVHLLVMADSDILCTITEDEAYELYSWAG